MPQPTPTQKPVGQPPQKGPSPDKNALPQKQPHPNDPAPAKPEKKAPAQEKDDALKYEMQYVNGGFNNGVQIKPDKNGKALIEISIYGGGEKKRMLVGPLPAEIGKLVKAYEISATQNGDSPEITGELQRYFQEINQKLSAKVIQILSEADNKVAQAIKEVFKSNN